MDNHDKERFTELGMLVFAAFENIRELLTGLPIPVELPTIAPDDDGDRAEALLSLDRARTIIKDEPISDDEKVNYEVLVIDWFTAYEMLILARIAGAAPWRLDCAEHALIRLSLTIMEIEGNETDIDES